MIPNTIFHNLFIGKFKNVLHFDLELFVKSEWVSALLIGHCVAGVPSSESEGLWVT